MSDTTLESIQSEIESLGSDSLEVVGGKFEGGIHLQQIPDEIAPCILDILKMQESREIDPIRTMLEIGSAAGGNAYVFNHFFNMDKIIIVDDNLHKKHWLRRGILAGVDREEFIGDSHSAKAGWFVHDLKMNFDILFIDGDHSHAGVKKDTETYAKFVKYEGFIIYHDTIACPGIAEYTMEIFSNPLLDIRLIKEYKSKKHLKPCGIKVFQSFNLPYPKWSR